VGHFVRILALRLITLTLGHARGFNSKAVIHCLSKMAILCLNMTFKIIDMEHLYLVSDCFSTSV
jgi:hypothetical protein